MQFDDNVYIKFIWSFSFAVSYGTLHWDNESQFSRASSFRTNIFNRQNPLPIWLQANFMFVSSDVLDIYRSAAETKYKHYQEKSLKVFMKLCFQNCYKQLLTSHHVQENLNVLKIPQLSNTKNAGLEISFQSALKSVKQAKVLPTIGVEVGISLQLHESSILSLTTTSILVHFLR